MKEHPDTPIVEMDSAEGVKGGKVLLTIHLEVELLLSSLPIALNEQEFLSRRSGVILSRRVKYFNFDIMRI